MDVSVHQVSRCCPLLSMALLLSQVVEIKSGRDMAAAWKGLW